MEFKLLQLVSPTLFVVFAGGFLSLYFYDRRRRSAGLWALSYLASAIGFLIDIFRDLMPPLVASIGSNFLYISTAVFFVAAVHIHCNRAMPAKRIAAIVGAATLAFGWYRFATPDPFMRTAIANIGVALVFLASLAPLIRQQRGLSIERFLAAVIAMFSLLLLARAAVNMTAAPATLNGLANTAATQLLLLHAIIGIMSLIAAMTIFVMLGVRIATDLRRQADTDPLTGLLNRRGFGARAGDTMTLLHRAPLPFAVVACDIDRFKHVNDTYGHGVGDDVIVGLAKLLGKGARESDLAARTGGEEFAVALWNTDERGARLYAEGKRTGFSTLQTCLAQPALRCTASFGIAVHEVGDTLEDLLERADQALYASKRAGRNRVTVASGACDDETELRTGT